MLAAFLRTHISEYYKQLSTSSWAWQSTLGQAEPAVVRVEAMLRDKTLVVLEKNNKLLPVEEQYLTALGMYKLAAMLMEKEIALLDVFDFSTYMDYTRFPESSPEAEFIDKLKTAFNENGWLDIARYFKNNKMFTADYFAYVYTNVYQGSLQLSRFKELLEFLAETKLLDSIISEGIDPNAENRLNALCRRNLSDGVLCQKLKKLQQLNLLTRDNFINLLDVVKDKLAEAVEALICLHQANIPLNLANFQCLAEWKNYCGSVEPTILVNADISELLLANCLTQENFILLTMKKVRAAEIVNMHLKGILQDNYDFLMKADSAQSCACGILIAHDSKFLTEERQEKIFKYAHNDLMVSILKLLVAAKICDEKHFDTVYAYPEIFGAVTNISATLSSMPAKMFARHFDKVIALCKPDNVKQSETDILAYLNTLLPQPQLEALPSLANANALFSASADKTPEANGGLVSSVTGALTWLVYRR